jgi:hypothetical protein
MTAAIRAFSPRVAEPFLAVLLGFPLRLCLIFFGSYLHV